VSALRALKREAAKEAALDYAVPRLANASPRLLFALSQTPYAEQDGGQRFPVLVEWHGEWCEDCDCEAGGDQ
jgi:hypothetical protein